MKRTLLILGMVVALVGFMAVGQAQAAYINGGISFAGGVTFSNSNLLSNPLSVTFANDYPTDVSGSYSSVPVPPSSTPAVTFQGFDIRPTLTQAITGLWSFSVGATDYSFDLTSASITAAASNSITIDGVGNLNITGLTQTPGTWVFTGNTAGGTFSFSASNAAAVPEPSPLLLLGVGLLGLGLFGLKRRWEA